MGGPVVPDVKYIKAGSLDGTAGPLYIASASISCSAELKSTIAVSVSKTGVSSSTRITCLTVGQCFQTRWNFCTLAESPTKAVAPVSVHRNSMSLSTRRVLAGHITIPARKAATAISHLCGCQRLGTARKEDAQAHQEGIRFKIMTIR